MTCSHCGKQNRNKRPLQTCVTCRSVRYCDRTCQIEHYKATHKHDCKTFKDPPLCRIFNVHHKLLGCEYAEMPILAQGYTEALGCWFSPTGNIDCSLLMRPEGTVGKIKPSEDVTVMEALGLLPGSYMSTLVCVQNRNKEARDLVVLGRGMSAIPFVEDKDMLIKGMDLHRDYLERDSPDFPGLKERWLVPAYCKVLYFNGRKIKEDEKLPQLMNETFLSVVLHPGEYVIFEVQWKAGGSSIFYDFQVWNALYCIKVSAQLCNPCGRREDEEDTSGMIMAEALVDQEVVYQWYKDFLEEGKMAYIESHYGKERREMMEAHHAILRDIARSSPN